MRLIDAENLIITEIHIKLHEDEPYKKYFQYYDPEEIDNAPTVKAIPIEWLQKKLDKWKDRDLLGWSLCVKLLIEDWEKENEAN